VRYVLSLDSHHRSSIKVVGIEMFEGGAEPSLGGDDAFVGMGIEPASPPTKGTIGDDLMLTHTHQIEVEYFISAVDEYKATVGKIRFTPIEIVRKN
jgi:hypothetical protein